MSLFDQIEQGFELVGPRPASGIFPLEMRPAEQTPEQLLRQSGFLKTSFLKKVSGAPHTEDADELRRITMKEVEAGSLDGPHPPEVMDARFPERSAALQGARPLDPLVPRAGSPQVLSGSEDSEDQWGHWIAKPSLPRRPVTPPKAPGTMAPETPPKAVTLSPKAGCSPAPPSPKAAPPPKAVETRALVLPPPPRPSSAPPTPLPPPAEGPYQWVPMSYVGSQHRAILSAPPGESYHTREMMGLITQQERELWTQARLRSSASRQVRPRRALPVPPAAPCATPSATAAPGTSPSTTAAPPSAGLIPGFGVILPPPPVPPQPLPRSRSPSPRTPPAVPGPMP